MHMSIFTACMQLSYENSACSGQKRASDPLERESQAVGAGKCALSSGRAADALNHGALSLQLHYLNYFTSRDTSSRSKTQEGSVGGLTGSGV